MKERWNILYRGPLSSCNYACGYCPFAKTRNSISELREDAQMLERFVNWVEGLAPREVGVLFTPWGEALVHPAYQNSLRRLSAMPHVRRAAIQTNLACSLDWLDDVDRDAVALWCTFHPTETSVERFVAKIERLEAMGVRHSVGVVGMKDHLTTIDELRGKLPRNTYLWVNAFKKSRRYYEREHIDFLTEIDPHFPTNLRQHPSLGKECRAGDTSFTVDGDGVARRCHFIETPIGNIYEPRFEEKLGPGACPNRSCGCHIGYVNLENLKLSDVYGDGILERIPKTMTIPPAG